jgi:hypothetical protein
VARIYEVAFQFKEGFKHSSVFRQLPVVLNNWTIGEAIIKSNWHLELSATFEIEISEIHPVAFPLFLII